MRQFERIDEKRIIAKAKEGDMEAFELLVRKYLKNIYFLCYQMTGTHQSADDLAQDTFSKAYFSLHKFKDGMSFFPWIRKIAVNNSLNYLKVIKREEPLGEKKERVISNPVSYSQELPQDKLQRDRMEQKFKEALRALPPDQKVVFVLRVYENQSYKDISRTLNISLGTVMSRLNRAREKIKAMMIEYI